MRIDRFIRRLVLLVGSLVLVPQGGLQAQMPCPDADFLDRFRTSLGQGIGPPGGTIPRLVSGIVQGCPTPPGGVSPEVLLDEVVRLLGREVAGSERAGPATRDFFRGLSTHVRAEGIAVPLQALADVVEHGAWPQARGSAVFALLRLSDRPDVAAYILELTRREEGPPGYGQLPLELIEIVWLGLHPGADEIRRTLSARPDLIRNATVRCMVENPAAFDRELPPGLRVRCPR